VRASDGRNMHATLCLEPPERPIIPGIYQRLYVVLSSNTKRDRRRRFSKYCSASFHIELAVMANRGPLSSAPQIDDKDLPANFRTKEHVLVLPSSNPGFLDDDLSTKRVENVLPHLWLVGRSYPARALNIQKVLRREIIPTTDASLHLVWTSEKIYVKALPRYITTNYFYGQNLVPSNPHGPALGLLFSYMALVPSELDFAIACESKLFHKDYDWQSWRKLTSRILADYPDNEIYRHISKRYIHGELRLSRLDKVYRYRYGSLLHGFSALLGSTRYAEFFSENFKFVTATTVYVALVLTAMQVGLAAEPLSSNESFRRASNGFTVFAILSPIIAVGVVVSVFFFMLLANWASTKSTQYRRFKDLGIDQFSKSRRNKHDGEGVAL
jgi:hypothetical protein